MRDNTPYLKWSSCTYKEAGIHFGKALHFQSHPLAGVASSHCEVLGTGCTVSQLTLLHPLHTLVPTNTQKMANERDPPEV